MAQQPGADGSRSWFDNWLVYLAAVLVPLAVGGGIAAYQIATRPGMGDGGGESVARLVRVIRPQKTFHRLAIKAYGTSRAAEVWTAIAEVRGRVEGVNPRFEPGEVLPAGTWLVRIDRTDYELAHAGFQADVNARELQIDELDQSEEQLEEILKLQERQLELAKAEYDRRKRSYEKNVLSLSALEQVENTYVAQQTAVEQTLNSLALIPVQRSRLQAALRAARAQRDQARRDVERCEIRLPRNARCASKSIEENQFVAAGERLGTFLTLEAAEVVAMAQTAKVATLMQADRNGGGPLGLAEIVRNDSLWGQFRIPVEVRWALGEESVVWWGRLTRIGSSLDPGTRTVPLIIEVRNPYEGIRPGVRPPLLPDVFCEITAYGATVDDVIVIPRDAVRDGRVFMLRDAAPIEPAADPSAADAGDAESKPRSLFSGKLHVQPVEVLALEDDLAVIGGGIESGELVILSDLPRVDVLGNGLLAIEDMPLRGELVENPVGPRMDIGVPDDLFEEVGPADVGPAVPADAGQPEQSRPSAGTAGPAATPAPEDSP